MHTSSDHFPGLPMPAEHLVKYYASNVLFSILLRDETIIHFTPADGLAFERWLSRNNIKNLRLEVQDIESTL